MTPWRPRRASEPRGGVPSLTPGNPTEPGDLKSGRGGAAPPPDGPEEVQPNPRQTGAKAGSRLNPHTPPPFSLLDRTEQRLFGAATGRTMGFPSGTLRVGGMQIALRSSPGPGRG